ncbi:TetR/AcrR family transcriptional regulator [Actinoplanes couchii]|uniref:TetR family transcriptional regulator n=1 Tax=Actinoplanes couchii TaxID=403638 RepID=A0ABQ3X721_9ACTN|nr:TetR/AcrR family transcriptional regulator [Actinoplanes couchii]MDR6322145.1 AcrR family transcriptional regulator [Actinoplanes couchii]GID54310.1 TetR family transcriptional regulator [Actinoplanes couchii]
MARPRQFDEKAVLTAVRDQFWTAGYAGTSLDDLLRVTGLGKGSLYAAFGDKRSLHRRVLGDYVEATHAALRAMLTASPRAVDGLRRYLTAPTEDPTGAAALRGCFLGNSTSEMAAADTDMLAAAHRAFEERTGILAEAVARAQHEGDLPTGTDPAETARAVVTAQQGVVFMGRTGMDVTALRAVAETLADRILSRV